MYNFRDDVQENIEAHLEEQICRNKIDLFEYAKLYNGMEELTKTLRDDGSDILVEAYSSSMPDAEECYHDDENTAISVMNDLGLTLEYFTSENDVNYEEIVDTVKKEIFETENEVFENAIENVTSNLGVDLDEVTSFFKPEDFKAELTEMLRKNFDGIMKDCKDVLDEVEIDESIFQNEEAMESLQNEIYNEFSNFCSKEYGRIEEIKENVLDEEVESFEKQVNQCIKEVLQENKEKILEELTKDERQGEKEAKE